MKLKMTKKMMIITKRRNDFTLLEIVICIALLGIITVSVSWQMKGMIAVYWFQKSIDRFYTDLCKAQLIALSDRIDLEIQISKSKKEYQYVLHTDNPTPCLNKRPTSLKGIKEIWNKNKRLDQCTLHVYPSGRITGGEIKFIQEEKKGILLDLSTPPCIELKKLQPTKFIIVSKQEV